MNSDTGRIRYLAPGEKPKANEVLVNQPNPNCRRCHGKGSILANRAERRHPTTLARYSPCPECSGKE